MQILIVPDWDGTYHIEQHFPIMQDKTLTMCEKVAKGFKSIEEARDRVRFMEYENFLIN